ncbi:MAG: TonB-dependent receptor [Ignavibacteriales bacterium]|nr:TonB-dependent receptor [Ignavibacteriales bacterium]
MKYTKIFLIVLAFYNCSLAQTEINYNFDEIVVSASRYEENTNSINQALANISAKEMQMTSQMNLANALSSLPGIWMQQTNHGGGSPFIRGLTGNQTLIMIDGIRLNNSTFRYGPNQYLNTISLNDIDRAEILRGSGSVQYGSDALGGVLQIISKSPQFSLENKIASGVGLKYLSGNMEKSADAYLDYSTSHSGYHISASAKQFGDIIAGKGLGKESPSSYDEISFNIKNLHKINDGIFLTYNFQYLQQNDIDRFDQVSQRGYDYYKFDPQKRQLAYIKSEFLSENKFYKDISITLSWQQSSETRRLKKSLIEIENIEKDIVDTWGANISIISNPLSNWKVNSGLEYYFDFVNSSAKEIDLLTENVSYKRGLYSDNSKAHNFSIFTLSKIKLNNFDIGFGGRYNLVSLIILDNIFGQPNINPSAVTGHFSLAYNFNKNYKIIGNINSAYRIPNINDVSTFGFFDYGIEVPNNELSPETALNYELGFKFYNEKIISSLFLYYCDLTDLIDRVTATYNGSSTLNGENVYKKINVGKAYIRGIEFDFKYVLFNKMLLKGNIAYTYGQNISKDEPMRRIPPINGSVGLIYKVWSSLDFRFDYTFAMKQNRLSSGDIDDHRISENGTPAWNVFNLYANYNFKYFSFGLGINNIFDEAYRVHGSGIDGIGRSLQVVIKFNI